MPQQAMATVSEPPAQPAVVVPLPQLLDVGHYNPNTLKFIPRAALQTSGQPAYPALEDWIEIFRHSIGSFRCTAEADPSLPEPERLAAAARFADAYLQLVDEIEQQALAASSIDGNSSSDAGNGGNGRSGNGSNGDSSSSGARGLGCLELCQLREDALLAAGFKDIFRPIKDKENIDALDLLPDVCAELDQHTQQRDRWDAVIRGVFAGNIFDLGCAATTDMYHQEGVSFHATRDELLPRPWVMDDFDALLDRLCSHVYQRAVLFVDNSGADVLLGMLPFARELLRAGSTVIVAANSVPSINDITAAELDALLPQICAADPVLCKGVSTRRLQLVPNGSGLPVIDLSKVSAELAEAAVGADLIVLEGMGRSIETNLHARLSCDTLNIGMIKHPEVAAALGGRLYDCVCQFRRAPEQQ